MKALRDISRGNTEKIVLGTGQGLIILELDGGNKKCISGYRKNIWEHSGMLGREERDVYLLPTEILSTLE